MFAEKPSELRFTPSFFEFLLNHEIEQSKKSRYDRQEQVQPPLSPIVTKYKDFALTVNKKSGHLGVKIVCSSYRYEEEWPLRPALETSISIGCKAVHYSRFAPAGLSQSTEAQDFRRAHRKLLKCN